MTPQENNPANQEVRNIFDLERMGIGEAVYSYAAVVAQLSGRALEDPEYRKYEVIAEEFERNIQTFPAQNPSKGAELYEAMARSSVVDCRKEIAAVMSHLAVHDADKGVDLWVRLLTDANSEVAATAQESLTTAIFEQRLDPQTAAELVERSLTAMRSLLAQQ